MCCSRVELLGGRLLALHFLPVLMKRIAADVAYLLTEEQAKRSEKERRKHEKNQLGQRKRRHQQSDQTTVTMHASHPFQRCPGTQNRSRSPGYYSLLRKYYPRVWIKNYFSICLSKNFTLNCFRNEGQSYFGFIYFAIEVEISLISADMYLQIGVRVVNRMVWKVRIILKAYQPIYCATQLLLSLIANDQNNNCRQHTVGDEDVITPLRPSYAMQNPLSRLRTLTLARQRVNKKTTRPPRPAQANPTKTRTRQVTLKSIKIPCQIVPNRCPMTASIPVCIFPLFLLIPNWCWYKR